jgi:enoyl-CoA hydratase/carnithine racemase
MRDFMLELLSHAREQVMLFTLNRPQRRNALSTNLLQILASEIKKISENTHIRAVIISGAESKAFCAGADLKERQSMSDEQTLDFLALIQGTFQALSELSIPTIAAINGDAFGGGLELALACDIRIASLDAHLGLTECSLGVIPGAGGTQRLPALIGFSKAAELIFSARRLNALEAFNLGLINDACAPEETLNKAYSLAATIALQAPLAVRAAKKALKQSENHIKSGLAGELAAYKEILKSFDRKEGLLAFIEKRKAHFRGC